MIALPRYVPDYKIQINGENIPNELRSSISSVTYQDGGEDSSGKQAASRVEIEIANTNLRWLKKHIRGLGFRPFPSGVQAGLGGAQIVKATTSSSVTHIPEGIFDLESQLSLAMGYATDYIEDVFTGEITGLDVNFPNSGMSTMTLVAHDYLHRLSRGSYSRGFGPVADFLIAAILSAENLLAPIIDPSIVGASAALSIVNHVFNGSGRKQKAQSDLELMQEIADIYDADFWVDGNVFYLSRFLKDYSPSLSLTWGKSLLSFSPKVTTIGQVAGISVNFTLREIPLSFVVTVSWDVDRESLVTTIIPDVCGTAVSATKTLADPILSLINRPISSPVDITNSALFIARELRRKLNNRLTGTGTAIGDPRIRAGVIIRLQDLGPDFSGDYRVVSANHVIDSSGYLTQFSVRKEIIP